MEAAIPAFHGIYINGAAAEGRDFGSSGQPVGQARPGDVGDAPGVGSLKIRSMPYG